MDNKQLVWIDEYAKSWHNAMTNMAPSNWGPTDWYVFFTSLEGTFLDKLSSAIKKVQKKGYSKEEVMEAMPNVSTVRAGMMYFFMEYAGISEKEHYKEKMKEVTDYFLEILKLMTKDDLFCKERNIVHNDKEIKEILKKDDWVKGNLGDAREIGKLYNSFSALGYSLYRDYFIMIPIEIYGPYDASKEFGEGSILLIKHITDTDPVELWPGLDKVKYKDIKIYQIFKNINFKCEFIGMHSIYEGNITENLDSYMMFVDGELITNVEKIKEISDYVAIKATEQSKVYKDMSKEDLIRKTLEWYCYIFFEFFKLAGMDWRPTEEMINALKDKHIPDRYVADKFASYDDYVNSKNYEVYWLKELYGQ
jgi:hypothetical protein